MYQDPSTGDPTRPVADPALNLPTSSPVSPAQTQIDPQLLLTYDRRVRDLQSVADKQRAEAETARREAERLAAEKAEADRKIAELEATQSTIVKGAAQTAQEYIARMQEVERKFQEQQALAMKAQALMAHPELKEYAALIPVTTDEALLNQAIETLVSARQRDLDSLKEQMQSPPAPQQSTGNVLDLYPRNQLPYNIPSASPARPSSSGAGNTETFNVSIDQKLKAAAASGDPREFERVLQEVGQQAEAQIRQTLGNGPYRG